MIIHVHFLVGRVGDFDSLKFELLISYYYSVHGGILRCSCSSSCFRNMCWNLLTSTGQSTSKYLYAGDTVGPGKQIWLIFNFIISVRSQRVYVLCVPLGLYGIDLRQHPQAQLISDAAGLDDIPERFVGSR